ncbi:hypothetical protein CNMCM6805_000694 [Aspergillus fumigatiaffinis]|uniref:Heterokaryon incompatibility domain-containing protein n=1 Tax=Aspergillus fumigatiaffinis TaxID=340414 RepID=A0A8H4M6J6_9EURO|nr:hypothetical protein CNMCM5878_002251 [Aspergillus fumigatiaffinis]KAF4230502.1 hypothetical protein CNMCM6805_000694 [Aspergillus fumigatiaffinis]
MNSLGTVRAALADTLVTNSALKEAFDLASFVTDRSKRFKDVALDQDQKHKLRRILNHFLTPSVQPKFVDDEDTVGYGSSLPDDWLAKTDEDLKTPARMIDIDTMNMVPTYNLGIQDQYCIVSHTWKGSEITYSDFTQAKTFEPTKKAANTESDETPNDVRNVVNKCKADIVELQNKIESALPQVKASPDGKRPKDITTLLEWYADANGAEYYLGSTQKKLHEATATATSAAREADYYRRLWETITTLNDDGSKKGDNKDDLAVSTQNTEMQQVYNAITSLTEDAEKTCKEAGEKHQEAVTSRAAANDKIVFFQQNREMAYGIDALLTALQHLRSSRKILGSIARAKELFDEHFPCAGKRYVWLDTCCINKGDTYELTESLALMGDWYTNADFCLVHLDTPRDERAWIEEWKYWKDPSYDPVLLNMTSFDKIGAEGSEEEKKRCQVEWATRGWTLQELVLSKVTYYVNSHWQKLDRPIEVLGPLYFLRPFILRYLQQPYVKRYNAVSLEQIDKLRDLLSPETIKPGASKEEELTTMLQALGFVAPRGLQEKLAESQLGKAVLTATRQLPKILNDLLAKKNISDADSLSNFTVEGAVNEKIALFNHLLAELVRLADKQILDDRKFIAKFSKIENMTSWIAGDGLSNSSASTSLVTAAERVTTVATDRAYSLMGILGVRYPAFPAEGLPKALARLLDEVVIAYNDVSVFNWSGKHSGSPLHGRSLYPATIDAFVDPTKHPMSKSRAQTSKKILDLFRAQRVHQSKTAANVNMLLAEILALSKKLPEQCSVFEKLGDLATKIKIAEFEDLKKRIGDLKGIVVRLREFVPDEADEASKNQPLAGKLSNAMERVNPFSKDRKFGAPEFESPKFEVPKFEAPKLGSFGWAKKGRAQPAEKAQPSEPATPTMPATPAVTQKSPAQMKIEDLNEAIRKVIDAIGDSDKPEAEPAKDVPLHSTKVAEEDALETDEHTVSFETREDKRMTCPNPITVNSGGIRGIFDIQRIIVTMVEPEVLRSKVRTAVRGQKIDGWCTISTGLSMTLVAFCAERDVLAQQLDLADVIKSYLEPEDSAPKDSSALPLKNSKKGLLTDIKNEKTPEQAKVARMINFVQKQDLHGIAGEWVLARFSGTPGAKWFLCLLELGAGNDFYGHRIPTDAFSFEDAAPEQGIIQYWHKFTMEKKARTCDTLDMYLNRQKLWSKAGRNLESLSTVENPTENSGENSWETAWEIIQNVSLDKVVNLGKMAGQGVGGLGAELWANHLEGRIERGALKRIPVSLRTPVRDLDHNRKLLPVMFHAGREMHMF